MCSSLNRSLTFSPDSQKLLTGSDDGHMKIYDVWVDLFISGTFLTTWKARNLRRVETIWCINGVSRRKVEKVLRKANVVLRKVEKVPREVKIVLRKVEIVLRSESYVTRLQSETDKISGNQFFLKWGVDSSLSYSRLARLSNVICM